MAKAVDLSGFDLVVAQKQAEGFGEKKPLAETFFHKDQLGGWRKEMDEEQAAALCAVHDEVMGRFGYGG